MSPAIQVFFFSSTQQERYQPFCADFGPINLAEVHRGCLHIHSRVSHPKLRNRPSVYYSYNKPEEIANAAFLCCAYAVLYQGQTPKEVILNPKPPRRKPSNLDPERHTPPTANST